jgi:tripartite-type tricarboxylate transporter receptor subunit TctC
MSDCQSRANRLLLAAAFFLAAAAPLVASAQPYPNKPIRWLVGYAAGGATDLSARVLAEKISARLGQPVLIENRPGAGAQIAIEAVQKSAPDGYTFGFTNGASLTILPLLAQVGFNTLRDFTAVATVGKQPLVLVAAPQLGVSDFASLRKKLVAEPDKHAYGSAGPGTGSHTGPAYLVQLIGAKVTHVPYKGTAPAIADLISGRLSIHVDALSVLAPLLQSSKVVGIAVMDHDRVPGMALPTIAEAGLPDYLKYEWSSWFIVFAPKGVPAPILERLNAEIAVALKDDELVKRYREFGLTPTPRTVAAANAHLEQDVKAWPPVFKALGLAQ